MQESYIPILPGCFQRGNKGRHQNDSAGIKTEGKVKKLSEIKRKSRRIMEKQLSSKMMSKQRN